MSLIDQLITDYAAPDPEFTLTLPKGETLKFRAVSDYSELQKLKQGAQKFAALALDAKRSPQWKEIRPGNETAALAVFFIAETIIEPAWTQKDVLTLAKRAGWLVEYIFSEINKRQTALVQQTEEAELGELKNA